MTDHIDMVYIENEIELSWPMGLGTVRSMMKTRLDNDVSDCKGLVYAKPKLNYRDLFDRVCSVMKIR